MEKLRFVKAISKIPKTVVADIEWLNALRNGLAHTFFPENLRLAKPVYKEKSIFTVGGVRQFLEDMATMTDFFVGA